jgi:hypothetical protein
MVHETALSRSIYEAKKLELQLEKNKYISEQMMGIELNTRRTEELKEEKDKTDSARAAKKAWNAKVKAEKNESCEGWNAKVQAEKNELQGCGTQRSKLRRQEIAKSTVS